MEFVEKNNILVPKIGLGTYSMSKELLERIIPASSEIGYTLIDTANKYQNEIPLGNILKKYGRNRYLIETKVHPTQLLGNIRYLRLNRKDIRSTYHKACMNLQTDHIDVFMIHGIFNGYEKYLNQLLELKKEGKVGLIGICNINVQQLSYFHSCHKQLPDIIQVEIHPYHSNKELVTYCKENSVLVEARSPFAHGDAMDEWCNEDILKEIAEKHHATIPQVILRWITQQDLIAITRTTNISHLKENIDSLKLELTDDDIYRIDSLNKNLSFGYVSTIKK